MWPVPQRQPLGLLHQLQTIDFHHQVDVLKLGFFTFRLCKTECNPNKGDPFQNWGGGGYGGCQTYGELKGHPPMQLIKLCLS